MVKTQLITMHRTAPRETAYILRQTAYWECLGRYYDSKKQAFDADGLEKDPACLEGISKLAASLQRTQDVEKAKSVAEALLKSPHRKIARMLSTTRDFEAFKRMAHGQFPDTPSYSTNARTLLILGGLKWKTRFEVPEAKAKPRKTEPKEKDTGSLAAQIEQLKTIVKNFAIARTGVDEEALLSLAALIRGEAPKGGNMPEFHETGYGRRFFDSQLPRLIESLEPISKSVSQLPRLIEALESIAKSLEDIKNKMSEQTAQPEKKDRAADKEK